MVACLLYGITLFQSDFYFLLILDLSIGIHTKLLLLFLKAVSQRSSKFSFFSKYPVPERNPKSKNKVQPIQNHILGRKLLCILSFNKQSHDIPIMHLTMTKEVTT